MFKNYTVNNWLIEEPLLQIMIMCVMYGTLRYMNIYQIYYKQYLTPFKIFLDLLLFFFNRGYFLKHYVVCRYYVFWSFVQK